MCRISELLTLRAGAYAKIRNFFAERGVLEVETPLLLPGTNPAPHLDSFVCDGLYLQTSPETAMKSLLAQGSGDIYQLCKAFRKNELGRLHNPEFTMLEWYRLGFDHHKLMDEVEELVVLLLKTKTAARYTYEEVYREWVHLNPHEASLEEVKQIAQKNGITVTGLEDDKDSWIQLLFTELVEPNLEQDRPVFIYDFPSSQAMLARVRSEIRRLIRRMTEGEVAKVREVGIASRFELYYRGMELANGFHELNDPEEQLRRFNNDLAKRKALGIPTVAMDHQFISLLSQLPDCSGVALGIDRLLLLGSNCRSLDELILFRRRLQTLFVIARNERSE